MKQIGFPTFSGHCGHRRRNFSPTTKFCFNCNHPKYGEPNLEWGLNMSNLVGKELFKDYYCREKYCPVFKKLKDVKNDKR